MKKGLLFLMMLSALSIGAWAQTSPYTGVAVGDITSDQSFYLYNVDFGTWLGDNDRNKVFGWTSHAEIGSRGRDIQITAIDGGYQLNPKLGHNHSINADNLYMDTDAAVTTWTITALNNGISNAVKIKSGSYGLSVNDAGDMDQNAESGEKHNNWQIVTAEERWNVAKTQAAAGNAVNVSWCVLGGTFPIADEHRSNGTWNGTTNGNSGYGDNANGGDGTYHCNRVWEMWNITSKDVYQTITVPNGIYKVGAKAAYVSTGGGGMSSAHYDEWLADPTGNTKGVVYANSQSVPMINAYAMTSDSKVDNKITKDLGNGKWVSDGTGQFSTRMFDGDFKTNDIWVNVTDNTLKVGVKVENGTGSSWILFDDFTVTYYGEASGDFATGINKANSMIGLGKMSAAGTTTLKNALSSSATLSALNTAIDAAVVDLKQNMAEKSTQPTIFTMVSESVVGTDDNTRGTVVTNHDDGFYIYNVGTGRWFCGGDDWGAHAAVGFPGIKVTTPENNYVNGHYNSVVTWLFNGNWGSGGQLNHDGYCDTGGNGWKFWTQNEAKGIYTVSRNGRDNADNEGKWNSGNGYGTSNLLGFEPSTYARANTNRTSADDPYNQWIFVTEAQRDEMAEAAMATASEKNPVDLTYKIKMPGFNQRERKEGENQSSDVLDWTCNRANYRYNAADNNSRKIIMGRGDNHADFVCDVYGDTWDDYGNGDNSFSWTQTVTGLTPGRYRVKVQGYNNGGDAANKAYLEANGQKATLVERSRESVLPWTTRLPESTFEAPEYFQAGCYWNEVLCTVGSEGELELGVKSPSVTGSHVFIFDNFRLEYVGLVGATIGDANYTTFVAPYNIPEIPEGVEAYACQVGTNYVHLEPVEYIPQGEAVVLKNTGSYTSYTFTPTTSPVDLGTDNDLLASDGSVTGAPGNIYALAKKNGEVGFYLVNSDVTVPAGKGYLVIGSGSSVKAFYGFDEDDATAIEMVNGQSSMVNEIYNLAGQRLNKVQKGINIINGKKTLK